MTLKNGFKNLFEGFPIGLCATMVGFCTVSNAFALFDLTILKNISIYISILVVFCFVVKFCFFSKSILEDIKNHKVGCTYPTFAMLLMIISSYFYNYNKVLARGIWFVAVFLNFLVIILFTYYHVVNKFEFKSIFPGWFVLFIGIMVSVINNNGMENSHLVKFIYYFGFSMYVILLPTMIFRVIRQPIEESIYPSLAIFPAPPSLCMISTIILYPNNNISFIVIGILYLIIQSSLFFVYVNISKFFRISFSPIFASLTFPLAISCFSGFKYSDFLSQKGFNLYSNIVRNIAELEMFVAIAVILFIFFKFICFVKNLFLDGLI